ncbi:MAG TPA: M56 family metallopeptidase [Solirubrobacterales bacterium]|jgi:beta-lactamase regulating signal transducer with metallopeptidase domain
MDSAGRNFAFLVGTSLTLLAYGVCGLIVYALLPLLGGAQPGAPLAGALALALLFVLLAAALALGVRAVCRHRAASRRLVRRIEGAAVAPAAELRAAARAAGLGGRIVLVERTELFSFVYGLFAPRVAISAGMLDRLSPEELRAALEHERYHVRNLDPLRELIGRVLAESLFFLPLISLLHRRYATARELAADRRATEICGRRPLAGALLAALEGPAPEPRASVALGGSALLASRLSQLETGRPCRDDESEARAVAWSALGLAAVIALFLAAVYGVGGSAGMARMLAAEFAPANLLAGTAVCVAPVLCLAGLGYGRLAWGARRALTAR